MPTMHKSYHGAGKFPYLQSQALSPESKLLATHANFKGAPNNLYPPSLKFQRAVLALPKKSDSPMSQSKKEKGLKEVSESPKSVK